MFKLLAGHKIEVAINIPLQKNVSSSVFIVFNMYDYHGG